MNGNGTYSFNTTAGEQTYFWLWYQSVVIKSSTMWLVPFSIIFSLGFGFIGMNWVLQTGGNGYDPVASEFFLALSFLAAGLCGLSVVVVGAIFFLADYRIKRKGPRTVFCSEITQIIKFSKDGIELTGNESAVTFEWSSITNIVLFNGSVIIGAQTNYIAIDRKLFLDIDHLLGFLHYCRKHIDGKVIYKDASFPGVYKDQKINEFFKD